MGSSAIRYLDIGPMAIERNGEVIPVRARRVSAALAVLIVHANQSVPTDTLVEALWAGAPPQGAESTLDSHMWRLRQLLEPDRRRGDPFTRVVHDGAGYRLVVAADQVDSLFFESLTGQARDLLVSDQPERALARCDQALALWRGEPWTPHSEGLWATAASARLHQVRSEVRRHRIQCLLQAGNAEAALNDTEPLIAADPLDEGLWELSMLAAYRLGRVGQALETFTRARRVLIEEAGIEPGQQLRDLQSKILDRDEALAGPDRLSARLATARAEVRVPARRAELIGREVDLTQLSAAVTTVPLVTVVGPAGCGKTRLAIEVARDTAHEFPDGVWFVDLTGADDKGQLLDAVTSALGLAASEAGTLTEALRIYTLTKRMLLVLDNCEHLLDDVAELVDALLDQRSELALLATSREPLAVDGEQVHVLTPLPLPSAVVPVSPETLAQNPAVRLFLQRLAGAAPETFRRINRQESNSSDTVTELAQIADICESVDGLPLAIELAAGQARSYTLQEILGHVRADSASLSQTGRGGAQHHATLGGAIKLSVETLTPDELVVHRAVSVVPGAFTTELAAHLARLSLGRTAAALSNLAHRSMLIAAAPLRPGGPSLFMQLVTIRSHSQSLLDPDDRRQLARRRDEWVANLVADTPLFAGIDEVEWVGRIDDDISAFRATLQSCLVDRPHRIGAFVAPRLDHYCFYRGMLIELERWNALAAGSAAADPLDRLLARCCHLGVAAHLGDRRERSRQWMDDAESYDGSLSPRQTAWLMQFLTTFIFTCNLTGAVDQGVRAAAMVRRLADGTEIDDLNLLAQIARIASTTRADDPSSVLMEADGTYARARLASSVFAVWATATAGLMAASSAEEHVRALQWSDVILAVFERVMADSPPSIVEMRGLMQAASGQPVDAIKSIAHSRTLARRIGAHWPVREETPQVLAAAQSALATDIAEDAYQQGLLGEDQTLSA